jgi:hypothetical protein
MTLINPSIPLFDRLSVGLRIPAMLMWCLLRPLGELLRPYCYIAPGLMAVATIYHVLHPQLSTGTSRFGLINETALRLWRCAN